ncbi:hypothetical protein CLF_111252 [Clonorchis sinensis]|uniref:Uncharacterized protein n=1 Tax=Clonorchis sinensis TaxID=79923 RepID=G7YUJ3_CLOSI|nr:hypothetical protein CLF_111252 [Clonorchis sinensis]
MGKRISCFERDRRRAEDMRKTMLLPNTRGQSHIDADVNPIVTKLLASMTAQHLTVASTRERQVGFRLGGSCADHSYLVCGRSTILVFSDIKDPPDSADQSFHLFILALRVNKYTSLSLTGTVQSERPQTKRRAECWLSGVSCGRPIRRQFRDSHWLCDHTEFMRKQIKAGSANGTRTRIVLGLSPLSQHSRQNDHQRCTRYINAQNEVKITCTALHKHTVSGNTFLEILTASGCTIGSRHLANTWS